MSDHEEKGGGGGGGGAHLTVLSMHSTTQYHSNVPAWRKKDSLSAGNGIFQGESLVVHSYLPSVRMVCMAAPQSYLGKLD